MQTHRWATANVLDACAGLSRDQFHRPFDMGPGSLHATTTHILGSTRAWGDMLAGRGLRERLESGGDRSASELRALVDPICDALEDAVRAHPLDGPVTGERGGRSYTFTRGAVLTHVTTHGMHHRAQCLNMLRQIGIEKLPHAAVVEWMLMVDGQG
jgi:uncharacterized damage-inducible protein DinB